MDERLNDASKANEALYLLHHERNKPVNEAKRQPVKKAA
jgi:hypothetical protein